MKRFRFVSDDSGHTYAIPADKREEFNAQLLADQKAEDEWLGRDDINEGYPKVTFAFDDCRLDMHISNYTFTDLQEDSE